jgi:hypothetical protein
MRKASTFNTEPTLRLYRDSVCILLTSSFLAISSGHGGLLDCISLYMCCWSYTVRSIPKWLTVNKIGYFVRLPHYHALRTKLTFRVTSKVSCFQNNYLHVFKVNSANIGWTPSRWTSPVQSYTVSPFTAYLLCIPAYTQGPTQYTHEYK